MMPTSNCIRCGVYAPLSTGGLCDCCHSVFWKQAAGCSPPLTDLSPEDAIRRGRGGFEWISVKDRLPEVPKEGTHPRYLTLVPYRNFYRPYIFEDKYFGSADSWELEGVTHWMPLPELPEDIK